MKKILTLLLLMVSTNVLAEWTRVTESADGDMTVYADSETIKRKGRKVKIWRLFDFKTVQIFAGDNTRRYLSSVGRLEYDCEEETSAALDIYWYSGNMRQGDIVYSSTTKDEAISILPGSIEESLFKIACSNK